MNIAIISRQSLGEDLHLHFDYDNSRLAVLRKVKLFPGTRILETRWEEVAHFSDATAWSESLYAKMADQYDELALDITWFWIDISDVDIMQG